jgi:electron transport complex protein RnfC
MPIEEVPSPEQVILPLSEKPGIFSRPLVQRGESVFIGEKVAEDSEGRMTPVHAPISGRVRAIENYRFAEGGNTLSIFIESDHRESRNGDLTPFENFEELAPPELISIIRNAGIKIIPFEILPDAERVGAKVTPIREFVINGIGHGFIGSISRRLLVERSRDLLAGALLIQSVFRPEKIYLAVNRKHENAIQAISESGLEEVVEVLKLDVYYPLGHPHLLFKEIFKKEIPSPRGRAIDLGVAFAHVDTVIHAMEAVTLGRPLLERYVTVYGAGIKEPKNLRVRIGTPLKDLIAFCGGFKGNPGRLSLGNPMDGMAQFSLERPVLKDTRWLWVQPRERVVKDKYRACINCGDCVEVCPVKLMPNFLGKFCEFSKFEEAAFKYDLFTCIECGLCAYVCPARRPLVQFMAYGKQELGMTEKAHG